MGQPSRVKLDLGGALNCPPGYLAVDRAGGDVVVDLEEGALPFADNSVVEIRAHHILEHITALIPLMNECRRVLCPGGKMHIEVPRYPSFTCFVDPTHVRVFTDVTFEYFTEALAYFNYGILPWVIESKETTPDCLRVVLSPDLMFKDLLGFTKIVVTGPQRSGTTIAAEMIAADLGLECWRHERIPTLSTLIDLVQSHDGFVAQVPHLCRFVHYCEIGSRSDVAVVLIRRAIEEIIASQERIGWWPYEPGELALYDLKEGVISEVKYAFWERHQRNRIFYPFEIEYSSLAGHELWIPKDKRVNFGPRQTRIVE